MRQVTRKESQEFLRYIDIALRKTLAEVGPLKTVFEWRDSDYTAHARETRIYAEEGDSKAVDFIYEIED